MDTLKAFAMGDANRGKEQMVFDWDKAASLRKRREALLMAKIPKALELNKAEASILQNELF